MPPRIVVGADKMRCAFDFKRASADEVLPTSDEIVELLRREGIVRAGTALVHAAADAIRQHGELIDATVAIGIPATPSSDGRIEWLVDLTGEKQKAGTTDEHNRIDFRERRAFVEVAANQLIARWLPPTRGEPGIDVFGQDIKPVKTVDNKPSAGKNILVSQDGTELRAQIAGHLFVADRKISVDRLFEVSGDVDYKIGNIRYPGNVQISGSVLPGFVVEATGNLVINGLVEGAEIRADGDVIVNGGIVGQSRVLARGDISAKFVQDSLLQADGDITVADAIVQSVVSGCRNFKLTGRSGAKGIIGGKLFALHDVSSFCIGSEHAVPTAITIGMSARHLFDEHQLQTGIEEQKKENARVHQLLLQAKGRGLSDAKSEIHRIEREIDFRESFRPGAATLVPTGTSVAPGTSRATSAPTKRPSNVASAMTRPSALASESRKSIPPPSGVVRAYGTAFEGTTLYFGKRSLKIENRQHCAVFRFDAEEDTVVVETTDRQGH